jgi:hypothetical protein
MDSDQKNPLSAINSTKRRIYDECEQNEGVAWLTHGRELENYLSPRVIIAACKGLYGVDIDFSLGVNDKFDKVLDKALISSGIEPMNYAADKVKYARQFIKYFEGSDMSPELLEQIEKIAAKIKHWNT